jgi:hypothetical protein
MPVLATGRPVRRHFEPTLKHPDSRVARLGLTCLEPPGIRDPGGSFISRGYVQAPGHLPSGDAREAGLVEDADSRVRARTAAIGEGLAGVQADRGDRGEDADLRLPGLEPEPLGL